MDAYEQAIEIVTNYIEALEALLDEEGDILLRDVAIYGGTTISQELALAEAKLEDLEARLRAQR